MTKRLTVRLDLPWRMVPVQFTEGGMEDDVKGHERQVVEPLEFSSVTSAGMGRINRPADSVREMSRSTSWNMVSHLDLYSAPHPT